MICENIVRAYFFPLFVHVYCCCDMFWHSTSIALSAIVITCLRTVLSTDDASLPPTQSHVQWHCLCMPSIIACGQIFPSFSFAATFLRRLLIFNSADRFVILQVCFTAAITCRPRTTDVCFVYVCVNVILLDVVLA